jgi:hypothetical protein
MTSVGIVFELSHQSLTHPIMTYKIQVCLSMTGEECPFGVARGCPGGPNLLD